MVVGILRIRLHIRQSQSLKDKRQVLRSIKDKLSHHFNVAIAEIGENEDWQNALIGVSTVGNETQHVASVLDQVFQMVQRLFPTDVVSKDSLLSHFKDEDFLSSSLNSLA